MIKHLIYQTLKGYVGLHSTVPIGQSEGPPNMVLMRLYVLSELLAGNMRSLCSRQNENFNIFIISCWSSYSHKSVKNQ